MYENIFIIRVLLWDIHTYICEMFLFHINLMSWY